MRTVFTGFSPNTKKDDVFHALSFFVFPWKWVQWKKGKYVQKAETLLSEYFDGSLVITYDSGRTALYQALKALQVGEGDEVLVQAFTCVVVINAIRKTGATPVYVDIESDTLNMDPHVAKRKISRATKVIIIQHTFGLPANIDELLAIAKKHNLRTIEDCAHSLGARHNGQLTGTFADIGMLSFGGEKNISCVRGGALVTNNTQLFATLQNMHGTLSNMRALTIFQHLFHVVLFPIGKQYYGEFFGKALLKVANIFHLTSSIITKSEKEGIVSNIPFSKLPNALAYLLVHQISLIDEYNEHRNSIAKIYSSAIHSASTIQKHEEGRVYLRYPLFVENPDELRARAKKKHILLGNWYNVVIGPDDVDMQPTEYTKGSCPVAERRSAEIVNLPTNVHITHADAKKVLEAVIE